MPWFHHTSVLISVLTPACEYHHILDKCEIVPRFIIYFLLKYKESKNNIKPVFWFPAIQNYQQIADEVSSS